MLSLVIGSFVCQGCVLAGNIYTAEAIANIGPGIQGWSNVGKGVAAGVMVDLDQVMNNVSFDLAAAINQTQTVQKYLDIVISLIGNHTDHAAAKASLLAVDLRESGVMHNNPDEAVQQLANIITDSLSEVLKEVTQLLSKLLDDFLKIITPPLDVVAGLIQKYGPPMQQMLLQFSSTLDQMQKILDKIMKGLNRGAGSNAHQMVFETYPLFDVGQKGYVTADNLHTVGHIFQVQAFKGNATQKMIAKYGGKDGVMDKQEYANMMANDGALPDLMSTILRAYAKQLAQIGGLVAAARMRDQVASAVVQYFELVAAKNLTKVSWVAQSISNHSKPVAFTSCILIELCITRHSPDKYTPISVGELVVHEMLRMNPQFTMEAYKHVGEVGFYYNEGIPTDTEPECNQIVGDWIVKAREKLQQQKKKEEEAKKEEIDELKKKEFEEQFLWTAEHERLVQDLHRNLTMELGEELPAADDGNAALVLLDEKTVAGMSALARKVSEQRMKKWKHERRVAKAQRTAELFSSKTSQVLLNELLGGKPAFNPYVTLSPAQQILHAGVPAVPATLEFANWLHNNATTNALIYQHMSFAYSSKSSSALDSFATMLQGLVQKLLDFINMMETYASKQGIKHIEDKVKKFVLNAVHDVVKVVKKTIGGIINASEPVIEKALDFALNNTGKLIAGDLVKSIVDPLAQALASPLADIIGDATGSKETGATLAGKLSGALESELGNITESVIGGAITDILKNGFEDVLEAATDMEKSLSFVEVMGMNEASTARSLSSDELSGVWSEISTLLTTMQSLLPTATSTLKFAKTEVSQFAGFLNSIFDVFSAKGPPLLSMVSSLYKALWSVYFVFFGLINLGILYHVMWAAGFCGGPQNIDFEDDTKPPKTCGEKCAVCWKACCYCWTNYHDTHLCLWSCIIGMQIITLILFILGIVLCI